MIAVTDEMVEIAAKAFSDECDRMAPGDGQPPVKWETLDQASQDRFRQATRAALSAVSIPRGEVE